MAVKRGYADIDVMQAAKSRIRNVFSNNLPVYLSFSGGKDSLCIGHLVYSMLQSGEIKPDNLTVQFIDEEAIFPCIEESVLEWRKRFMLAGAKFEWYCLEVRHYNCFNELESDESFICWDARKRAVWVRQPPPFAIRYHPLLRPRKDTYQTFLQRNNRDGINITGVRAYESIQRLSCIASMTTAGKDITSSRQIYPIYDWRDNDVWLYLRNNNIKVPKIYLYLWQAGTSKRQLRVSQFFSIDTAVSLVKMNEYYPDLMERVIRREPNAYIAALYWDSEMFRRSTPKRRSNEAVTKKKDYKAEVVNLLGNIEKNFNTPHKRKIATAYKRLFWKTHNIATEREFRIMYEGLIAGDPKLRTFRALYTTIFTDYVNKAKRGAI